MLDSPSYGHRSYFADGFSKVEGWVDERVQVLLDLIHDLHREFAITGNLAEIGVHHGKFFIPLHNMLRAGERSVAIDIFDDP
jgi:hypothetical protein